MSDANRAALRYNYKDSTDTSAYGEDPAPIANMTDLRYLRESLELRSSASQSNEIRSDRITPDVFRTSVEEAGDIEGELTYSTWDDFFAFALGYESGGDPTWNAEVVFAANSKEITSNVRIAEAAIGAGVEVGDWIRIHASENSGENDGWWRVSAVDAGDAWIEVSGGTGGTGDGLLVNNAADTTMVVTVGEWIEVGVHKYEVYMEREYLDVTGTPVMKMRGLTCSGFRVGAARGGPVETRFSWLGADEDQVGATTQDTSTVVNTNPVIQTVDHIEAVLSNGVPHDVTEFSIEGRNGVSLQETLGTFGATGSNFGSFELSGDLTLYYDDTNQSLLDLYHDHTLHTLALVVNDDALAVVGNSYVFDVPGCRFTGGRANAEGKDQQVFQRMTYGAKPVDEGGTNNKVIRIWRWAGEIS